MKKIVFIIAFFSCILYADDANPEWRNADDAKYAGLLLMAFFNNHTYDSGYGLKWKEFDFSGSLIFTNKDMKGVLINSDDFGKDEAFFGGTLQLDIGLPEHMTIGGRFSYLPRELNNNTPDYANDDYTVTYLYGGLKFSYNFSHMIKKQTKGLVEACLIGNYNHFSLLNHKTKEMSYDDFSPSIVISYFAEKKKRVVISPYIGLSPIFSSFKVKANNADYDHSINITRFRAAIGNKFYIRPAYINLEFNPFIMQSYSLSLGLQIL
ncbi:MAG: hypothetical protein JXA60_12855 [Candidatus Coatesbacteria bacterium]|nr:hypothetical protein [Candidatus Coatesbacteria bacterium]